MNVFYAPQFLRSFQKLPRDIQDAFRAKEIVFKKDPFHPSLRTHKLGGTDYWSFSITYQLRIIFLFDKNSVVMINLGDHSLYRKKK